MVEELWNAEGECGQPAWGRHARKRYGKYKIRGRCGKQRQEDERFYSDWVPGLVPFQLVWANHPAKSRFSQARLF